MVSKPTSELLLYNQFNRGSDLIESYSECVLYEDLYNEEVFMDYSFSGIVRNDGGMWVQFTKQEIFIFKKSQLN